MATAAAWQCYWLVVMFLVLIPDFELLIDRTAELHGSDCQSGRIERNDFAH